MASLEIRAPPPFKHETPAPGRQIAPATALSHIQSYLEQTCTSPHLHPDALFTEAGITYAGSASTGGVVLHQLRRVEKGLQGVWLGRDLDLEEEMAAAGSEEPGGGMELGPDYQAQLRELGEGVVEGEVGDRNNAVADAVEEPIVRDTTSAGKKRRLEEMQDGSQVVDKEARKRAKAERRKWERKERHLKHQRKDEVAVAVDGMDDEDLIVHGAVHDETREEHDEAEPSTSYLPDKISSTITKTVEEVAASQGLDPGSLDRSRKDKKKHKVKHKDKDGEKDQETLNSEEKKTSLEKDQTPLKSTADQPVSKLGKPAPKSLTNGDAELSQPLRENVKLEESERQHETDDIQVPSSYDANAQITPCKTQAVVKETPLSKATEKERVNGHLSPLYQPNGGEYRHKDEERAKRKAERKQRREEKEKKRAENARKRAEKDDKKSKKKKDMAIDSP